jgi:hypothetical protein
MDDTLPSLVTWVRFLVVLGGLFWGLHAPSVVLQVHAVLAPQRLRLSLATHVRYLLRDVESSSVRVVARSLRARWCFSCGYDV